MADLSGIIMHSISGFYYVEAAEKVYECKAKGSFRNKKISPLVGDSVRIETDGDKGFIVEIGERKNFLLRPPVANLDLLFIVSSVEKPKPNLYVLDKLTAFAVRNGITPVMVFSKCDLGDPAEYVSVYSRAGFETVTTEIGTGMGLDRISSMIEGKICAFSGNSGVGKSSLLNSLCGELQLETNEISEKLGRGKHTTRSVRLYRFGGGMIADTPGFSSLDIINDKEKILKEDLPDCFPEFTRFSENCRFGTSCAHVNDKGCAVLQAVEDGLIARQRHENYVAMYEEVKNLRSWNIP